MKTTISLILILTLIIRNSSATNTSDTHNAKSNLFRKENLKSLVNAFVTCAEKVPLTDFAVILEDYMDTEDKIEDFVGTTIDGDAFLRILRFYKIHCEKLVTSLVEIANVISQKPAYQPFKKSREIIMKFLEAIGSTNLDAKTVMDLMLSSDVFNIDRTIQKETQKKLMQDPDFINLIKAFDEDSALLRKVLRRLIKRFEKNEAVQTVLSRCLKTNLVQMVGNLSEKIVQFVTLSVLMEKHQQQVPEKMKSQFFADLDEWIPMLVLYVQADGDLQNFVAYVKTDGFKSRVTRVYQELTVERGGENFIRDEL